ncbi:hypothetical protein EDD15DRAFT_905565 [Pisolithus albus]|nr:hypothetical protein EDD15DRAFT_905565 [Pisolithus albus]
MQPEARRVIDAPVDGPLTETDVDGGIPPSGDLSPGRAAVLGDLRKIPSVSLGHFESAALPPIPQRIDVTEIEKSLQCDATVWSGNGSLRAKPTKTGEGPTPTFSCVFPSAKQWKIRRGKHYRRLVFEEVCQPIYELRRLDIVFKTLMDVHKASQSLHRVDWVHRIISGGNVLPSGEMGKLADLEYAKHTDSNTTREIRTGTVDFMACEVEAQNYLFQLLGGSRPRRKVFRCPFRFNPLHDMESLWWTATWTLYYHIDQEGGRPSSEQIAQFHELFPGRLESSRFMTFSLELDYEVLPASFHDAGYEVEFMHQAIMVAYIESEKRMPPAYANPLEKLNAIFTDHLTSAVTHSRGISSSSPTAKRPQADPTPDTRDTKQPKRDDSPEHSSGGHE